MYDITKLERGEVSYKQTGILLDSTTAQSDEMDSSEAFPVQVLTCQGISQKSTKKVLRELTLRRLMSYIYIYGAPILDVSRSHTTTQHSR